MLIKTSKTRARHARNARRLSNKVSRRFDESAKFKGMVSDNMRHQTEKMLTDEPQKQPDWDDYARNI